MKLPFLHITGTGQPFFWLHGMLNSVESDSVYSLIDFNSIQDLVSVVRYNYCDQSTNGDYSWPALTDELMCILNAQNYDKVVLGGLSMGAATSLHAAVRFPERVKALVLVTPPPAWEMRNDVIAVYKKIVSKTNGRTVPEILKRIIQWSQDPPDFFEQIHRGTRQRLLDNRLGFEPPYYSRIYWGGAVSDLPSREQIAKIDVPTLIVSIPNDINHPFEMAQNLHQLIHGSELFVVSDYKDYQKLQHKVHDFLTLYGTNNKS